MNMRNASKYTARAIGEYVEALTLKDEPNLAERKDDCAKDKEKNG